MDQTAAQSQLQEMPEPFGYWRSCQQGEVLVGFGPRVLFRFDEQDVGMRNLAVVALTQAGAKGKEVAALFGLTAVHVSRLRRRVADGGSGALLPPRGAPRKLSEAAERRALKLAEQGCTGTEIARRLGVSEATISRLFARSRAAVVVQGELQPAQEPEGEGDGGVVVAGAQPDSEDNDRVDERSVQSAAPVEEPLESGPIARLGEVEVKSRYAGAMLLHPFLERLGAEQVLGCLPAGPARRYDATALVLCAAFGFALGSGSLEQTKHLLPSDAGALVGLQALPSLRTLRPRLAALAEASDPLAIQRSFATAMLAADEHPSEVFYVDDHCVTYWGGKPVAKGYNIRRHLAEPGRDDTCVVDDLWRAICFSSGEPRGLSVSMPEVLGELKQIIGQRPAMIGFDRGGSYPKTFNQITEAGMEWITWRRAPLLPTSIAPRRSWVQVNGKRRGYLLADEEVNLKGYEHGPVRQLSAYEHDKLVFQVLTSNHQLRGAPLVHRLKSRWCIENTYKYLEDHQQIHWLTSYEMDTKENTAKVKNPAHKAARAQLKTAESALADAERALGRAADAKTSKLKELRAQITTAEAQLAEVRTALKAIPAKLPANQLDPNAKRATPRLACRSLQMVCRLLAYNAELDLARRLNTYLADPDEYRTITRNLLHLGGTIAYAHRAITVTLDRPHPPRLARALAELIAEINAQPPHLPGDRRPISYRLKD